MVAKVCCGWRTGAGGVTSAESQHVCRPSPRAQCTLTAARKAGGLRPGGLLAPHPLHRADGLMAQRPRLSPGPSSCQSGSHSRAGTSARLEPILLPQEEQLQSPPTGTSVPSEEARTQTGCCSLSLQAWGPEGSMSATTQRKQRCLPPPHSFGGASSGMTGSKGPE